jgi:hypothetical protein
MDVIQYNGHLPMVISDVNGLAFNGYNHNFDTIPTASPDLRWASHESSQSLQLQKIQVSKEFDPYY